jgi:hypothetical protein
MSAFPNSPRIVKGGLVLLDPDTGAVQRIITLQYNPDSLTRSLQVQGAGAESGDRSEALRLKGPPVETIKLDAEIDATDQLEVPDNNPNTVQFGIHPQLAVLEGIIYPTSARLISNIALGQAGTIEIMPLETLLTVFVWSSNRVVPVRLTEFSVTEEAFDAALNPIRAKVTLGMRVLTVNDLTAAHRGTNLFLSYLQQKEQLAAKNPAGQFGTLGIPGIP